LADRAICAPRPRLPRGFCPYRLRRAKAPHQHRKWEADRPDQWRFPLGSV